MEPAKLAFFMKLFFKKLLSSERLNVVDIGANPIDGDPPYKFLLSTGLIDLIGFEPQEEALRRLISAKGEYENYYSYAIGNGEEKTLNVCKASGLTSLFEPDFEALKAFDYLFPLAEVVDKCKIKTYKLDEINEVGSIDYLKIDIQGGELDVFRSGRRKLKEAVAIQVEVSFVNIYKSQPCFGDVDVELRSLGFVPHCFAALKKWPISPCVIDGDPTRAMNQLLEADIVYVKDFFHAENFHWKQLVKLAIVAHFCYSSYDLAVRCLYILGEKRREFKGIHSEYLRILSGDC